MMNSYAQSVRWSLLVALPFVLTSPVVAGPARPPAQPPATILLVRHGEKPPVGSHLSVLGIRRAELIPQLFGDTSAAAPHNLPRPAFLFAASSTRKSRRPVETLVPLSEVLQVPINSRFGNGDHKQLAKLLLGGKFAGAVVLVSWRHDSLPALAKALGATPPYKTWPDAQFDRVWRIDYREGGPVLTDVPQGLVAIDSK
jgi:hypothetical protein